MSQNFMTSFVNGPQSHLIVIVGGKIHGLSRRSISGRNKNRGKFTASCVRPLIAKNKLAASIF